MCLLCGIKPQARNQNCSCYKMSRDNLKEIKWPHALACQNGMCGLSWRKKIAYVFVYSQMMSYQLQFRCVLLIWHFTCDVCDFNGVWSAYSQAVNWCVWPDCINVVFYEVLLTYLQLAVNAFRNLSITSTLLKLITDLSTHSRIGVGVYIDLELTFMIVCVGRWSNATGQ